MCYKLLERLALQRIDCQVETLLSPDQAGFRKCRSTVDQVLALSTYIENGFQKQLKTGAVFLDLTAAYDTVWHTGLLVKICRCLPIWFVRLVELLLRNRRFRVHMGDDTSRWRNQHNGLPQGSVLAPTLFNIYTNDLPSTSCRRFVYADDICMAHQATTFAELECTLTADLARITEYCSRWRLKPSVTKTVSSVFHLHNASASRELEVTMNGQRLRHEPFPCYLGVTFDRALTYKEHLTKTAKKLVSRNNLLMKLAGSTWGASANTLRTSALALCFSVAEYCCPVWFQSAHTHLVDVKLNTTLRLITGTLRPTPLPWLPVLANIEPPRLRRKAAADSLVGKVKCHTGWPLYDDIANHPVIRLESRNPIWNIPQPTDVHSQWSDDWKSAMVVNAHLVNDPANRLPGFDLPRHQWCLLNRFRTAQGPCKACRKMWGLAKDDRCDCGQLHTMSHVVNDCSLTRLDGGLQRLHLADAAARDWLTHVVF